MNTEKLILHSPITGTPFTLTGNPETGFFLRLGKYKITDNFPTEEEAEEQLTTDMWNIITRTCVIITETEKQISITTKNQ